ncbi:MULTISPECIES: RpiB/LacA/LacB family sugar-phosphate isomerase [unclassified Actinomyces]|uniref:RpiB/LacA/LacB family sugar-phosphate isomerase n=1 Tax=unclassified Actinomyces TaxID=2609248 RepID=UPI000D595CFE|nr:MULTISPECIES: RpiB/LacA/LacB family sugar-phosphate isomerase [unclassified Actinomyces]RAX18885.1 RpiB/LacA/LacB family sugar-phosphate isomerase [Actinomyces sp. Z5]RAX24386.1 RpiB/LacA/LacB family sugar-phosphate isomerase [Actinomyces sp. Z3]
MKLAFGCDPNATALKHLLITEASALGHEIIDYPSDDPIYANVAIRVAQDVAAGLADRGILLCGTGIGVSIAANKVAGAYCACISDAYQAQRAARSNDANLVSMGAQVVGPETAKLLLREYLDGVFDPAGRSAPKVDRIRDYEASRA